MADKKYIVPKGAKVTIEVNRRNAQSPKFQVSSPKGIIQTRKVDDYQARRLSGVLLNFYDLGQKWNGSEWLDLDFVIVPSIDVSSNEPAGTVEFAETEWTALKDKIFEVDLEDFQAAYRKLEYEKAELYGVDVYTGDASEDFDETKRYPVARNDSRWLMREYSTLVAGSKWTENGLKISKTANLSIISESAFVGFGDENIPVKVTDSDDYAAAAVDFSFNSKADIFLMPCPVFQFAADQQFGGVDREAWLNMLFTLQSRQTFLENDAIMDFQEALYSLRLNPFMYPFISLDIPAAEAAILSLLTSQADARYYVKLSGTGNYEPVGNFPYGAAEFIYTTLFTKQAYGDLISKVTVKPGTLVAMVKKSNNWYYFWADSEYELEKGFSFLFAE